MQGIFKSLIPVAIATFFLAGCATQESVEKAQATADHAVQVATAAQQTGTDAMGAAQGAQQTATGAQQNLDAHKAQTLKEGAHKGQRD